MTPVPFISTRPLFQPAYDHRNRLVEIYRETAEGYFHIQYGYDVFDRRVSRFVEQDTYELDEFGNPTLVHAVMANERFVYDGDNVVLDLVPAGGSEQVIVRRRYLHGPAVDQVLAQENLLNTTLTSVDRVYWLLSDNLGSTRELINNAGQLVEHFDYESFGTLIEGDDELVRPLFTGQSYDAVADIYDYGFRLYVAALGRFLTEDPIGRYNWQHDSSLGSYGWHDGLVSTQFADGMNPYALAGNNPTTSIDPSGLAVFIANRTLGGDQATNSPFSHTFVFVTDAQGRLVATYSWGNNGLCGRWFRNELDDRIAATDWIVDRMNSGYGITQVGGDDLNPFVELAFQQSRRTHTHLNGILGNNCKTESSDLVTTARELQRMNQRLRPTR